MFLSNVKLLLKVIGFFVVTPLDFRGLETVFKLLKTLPGSPLSVFSFQGKDFHISVLWFPAGRLS